MTSDTNVSTAKKLCICCHGEFSADLINCPNDGTVLSQVAPNDLVGTVLADRYEILDVIGGGGMGMVYRAKHRFMNRIVAVKVLHKAQMRTATALKRFQIEAQAASALSIPNIVTIYDFGISASGEPYMVMDFLEGRSLTEILDADGKFPVARALHVFIQIGNALAHAHSKGVIHRDIKPSNIVLVNSGEQADFVKIVDFGIAKMLDGDSGNLTRTGEVFGSPLYMSPEQWRGQKLDARADIYSFGSMMYRVLSGKPMFTETDVLQLMYKQVSEMPNSFASIEVLIPKELEAIVFKALAKDPDMRYQSMTDLVGALEQFRESWSPSRAQRNPGAPAAVVATATCAGAPTSPSESTHKSIDEVSRRDLGSALKKFRKSLAEEQSVIQLDEPGSFAEKNSPQFSDPASQNDATQTIAAGSSSPVPNFFPTMAPGVISSMLQQEQQASLTNISPPVFAPRAANLPVPPTVPVVQEQAKNLPTIEKLENSASLTGPREIAPAQPLATETTIENLKNSMSLTNNRIMVPTESMSAAPPAVSQLKHLRNSVSLTNNRIMIPIESTEAAPPPESPLGNLKNSVSLTNHRIMVPTGAAGVSPPAVPNAPEQAKNAAPTKEHTIQISIPKKFMAIGIALATVLLAIVPGYFVVVEMLKNNNHKPAGNASSKHEIDPSASTNASHSLMDKHEPEKPSSAKQPGKRKNDTTRARAVKPRANASAAAKADSGSVSKPAPKASTPSSPPQSQGGIGKLTNKLKGWFKKL